MSIEKWVSISVALLSIVTGASSEEKKLWPEKVDAVILLDENEFQVVKTDRAIFRKHRIVQINNDAGKRYGKVRIDENPYIKCGKITGRITDLDGNTIVKLNKDDIRKGPNFPGFVLYGDSRSSAFELGLGTFPYIVEYTYEREYKSLFFWPDWLPQEKVPVLKSTYRLVINSKIPYRTHAIGIEIEPQSEEKRGKSEFTWQLENIKPGVKERYMPPESRVQMALYFAPVGFRIGDYPGSFASWDGMAEWYNSLSAGKYGLPPDAVERTRQLVAETDSDRQKVRKLYAFLQEYTRYVAIELGIGGWQPYSAESIFKNRYGDCKDLSTFMIAMLGEVDIPAYPALIRTRDRGVLIDEFPSNQFNHCIAFVPLQEDTLWLVCTSDFLPAGDNARKLKRPVAEVAEAAVGGPRRAAHHRAVHVAVGGRGDRAGAVVERPGVVRVRRARGLGLKRLDAKKHAHRRGHQHSSRRQHLHSWAHRPC